MLETVLNELRAEGFLRSESLPPLAPEAGVSQWILALQMFGGWLAAVFMLLFLGMGAAPLVKGAANWIVIGLSVTALTGVLMGREVGGAVGRAARDPANGPRPDDGVERVVRQAVAEARFVEMGIGRRGAHWVTSVLRTAVRACLGRSCAVLMRRHDSGLARGVLVKKARTLQK